MSCDCSDEEGIDLETAVQGKLLSCDIWRVVKRMYYTEKLLNDSEGGSHNIQLHINVEIL